MAGERFDLLISLSDFPADSFNSNFYLTNSTSNIVVSGITSGTQFNYIALPSVTSSWVAGDYKYSITTFTGSGSTDKSIFEQGSFEITPDVTAGADVDCRTHAKKTLDAIEAVIEGRATLDQQNYSIAGRSITKYSVDDLLKFRGSYAAQVANELRKEKGQDGTIRMTFGEAS